MNYRHIFHAGNRCDVTKHAVLTLVLRHLRAKDKGFVVLDTHAGVGLYDLNDPRAIKTDEAALGIKSLLAAPLISALKDYYNILCKMNPLWDGKGVENFRVYPGSPLFTFHMLREQDRLIACELHPDDFCALRLCAPADKRFQIHERDGFEAMGAFMPPPEKRGLVLIDPPYEEVDEFERIVKRMEETYRRWSTGIYMIWYPIKDRPAIWKFHEALATAGIAKILCAEFIYDDEGRPDRLNGSGLILINPPWKLDVDLSTLFADLHKTIGTDYARSIVKWIAE